MDAKLIRLHIEQALQALEKGDLLCEVTAAAHLRDALSHFQPTPVPTLS